MNQHSKVILITGCSSGFGLLTAARLAEQGHSVIATMRNLEKREALEEELSKRNGLAVIHRLDVTDSQSIENTLKLIETQYSRLDVLINNAGYGMAGFFEDLTEQDIRDQLETNFFGVQNVTRQILPLMRKRLSGKIINISSVAGLSSSPAFGAYNSSKWALEGFSESLRYEVKPFGIDVACIEPGVFKTAIFYDNQRTAKNFFNKESPYYKYSQHFQKRVMDYVDQSQKDPEDVARLIEKLIHKKRMPLRNFPDPESRFMYTVRKILPFSLYSRIVETASFRGMDD